MNITPISFGKIVKITGNNPKAAAQKITGKNPCVASMTLDNNKSAYIVTDYDFLEFHSYYTDMIRRINSTATICNNSEEATKIATEIEFGRFLDKTKMLVLNNEDITIDTNYNEERNEITSFEIKSSM